MNDIELLEWMQDLFQHADDVECAHIAIDEQIADTLESLGYKESASYYRCLIRDGFWFS